MTSTYLKHIFIITCCHFLQFRPVRSNSSNPITSERRNFSKPWRGWISEPTTLESTHRLSNSCLRDSFWQSRMRSRCMKIAFQIPSSTSCNKSTTTMLNILKPHGPNRREKAFWWQILIWSFIEKWNTTPWSEQGNLPVGVFLQLHYSLLGSSCIWSRAQP